MPKHIGIAAVSPEGSAFCYRLIGRRASEVADPSVRPLVSLHNRPFSTYVESLRAGDWAGVAEMLIESAHVLHRAGADFCVVPDNVAHHALPMAEGESPIPWLSMIDLVADAVDATGSKTIGLIGTKFVMAGSTYQTALGLRGIHLLVPEDEEADAIDQIIFREAIYGSVTSPSQQVVHDAIGRLAERECASLILGCSEASLLIGSEACPLPPIDPVELLAEAAVAHAIDGVQARSP